MTSTARVVAVTPGAPFALETFSGISHSLLEALDRRGALRGAVDGRTSVLPLIEKAGSFSPDLERWKQRYNAGASPLSPAVRRAMSIVASRRASAVDANVLLQLTGWFDPTAKRAGVLRCSYHDGNLAGFLRRPDLRIAADSRPVSKALAYERRLYGSIDLIFCMSERLRRSFIEDFGQSPEKVFSVGAGANVTVPSTEPARQPTPPRLLFVGKQFDRKGGPTVLAAFRRLRAETPGAELWIVGPKDLEISEPGVVVHGRISREDPEGERRLARLYADATAFVMPSVYEPFGIALAEAMAYRLPCIGSSRGAIPELIEDGVTGYLIEAGDEDALLERMRRLSSDPEGAALLGRAGFARFESRFTWDGVADRILSVIEPRLRSR